MDIIKSDFDCDRCGKRHTLELDKSKFSAAQLRGEEPVLTNFVCPDMATMFRVVGFAFDFTVNSLKDPVPEPSIVADLKAQWGEFDFDNKLVRFIKLDLAFIGVSDEYYHLLKPIIASYCCGNFYPAMTSAGALGERILNRLMFKTKEHIRTSPHYRKIYNKESSDRWEFMVEVLLDWKIISAEVGDLFLQLKRYRNDSIHYNDGYDFDTNAHNAVKLLAQIINGQFNYMNRPDLFWLFDCPGEIWIRSSVLQDPFVMEFILPQAMELTPFCEPMSDPPVKGRNVPIKPLTDEEFISIRNGRGKQGVTAGDLLPKV